MVREIVHIQVGQCGNQIGNVFWNMMRAEHMLNENGLFTGDKIKNKNCLEKVDVYFHQVANSRYIPRAILVDLEPGALDTIKASSIGKLFKSDNFAFGVSGAANNWAKGHYTDGAELMDEVIEIIRKEMEACDCPQVIQLTQSLGGGTGSGMGTLALLKCRDAYPDRILATYSVFPSKVSNVVVEPYNATLSIHQLLENSDQTYVIDNEALTNICSNVLKLKTPKFDQLNQIISLIMSGVTASLRFSGKLNSDLRKIGVNLVPFPRLHFFLIAHAPLLSHQDNGRYTNLTVRSVTSQLWSGHNFMSAINTNEGKFLAASLSYRGDENNLAAQDVDNEVGRVQQQMGDEFVKWIPNNIKSSMVLQAPNVSNLTATFVANTTSMQQIIDRISKSFEKMYKRKAFLHWYKGEGMDDMEFQEAHKNAKDLIVEYQDKENAVIPDNDDDKDNENDDIDDGDDDFEEF